MDGTPARRVRELAAEGLTRHARDTRYAHPYWGVRSAGPAFAWPERARALLPRMPEGAFFSHGTAALLWGLPLPRPFEEEMRPEVTVPPTRRAMDTADVIGHASRAGDAEVVELSGVPVSAPARAWRELSARLDVPDLVALGDAILHRELAGLAEFEEALRARGFRGRRTALSAFPLLDGRAESRPESLLRVALIRAGLPSLLVNEPLLDGRGRFVARNDLRFRDHPVCLEYEGDGHRSDVAQWRRDVERAAAIQDAGVEVIRVTGDDLPRFPRAIRRARASLARHGWRP